jgi:hypothetical protein
MADEIEVSVTGPELTDQQRLAAGNVAELVKEFFRKYVPMASFGAAKEDMGKIIVEANRMGADMMYDEILKGTKR